MPPGKNEPRRLAGVLDTNQVTKMSRLGMLHHYLLSVSSTKENVVQQRVTDGFLL